MADTDMNVSETTCEPEPEPESVTKENNESSIQEPEQENNDESMEVVTMVDVLKEEQELEEDANAVLGGSDEKNCTYSKGYLKRQALYACVTCIPDAKTDATKRAGVCLACSYHCHEGHELIELYTKRNFRCDCGNQKFNKKCNSEPEKSELNDLNTYNHNFSGLYCICERPYPDPDDKIADEMIQCIICEDWLHCRHLGVSTPTAGQYSEMICANCVSKHEFLLSYTALIITKIENDKNDIAVDVSCVKVEAMQDEEDKPIESEDSLPNSECKKPKLNSGLVSTCFWIENWREQLCTCKTCMETYGREDVMFLLDMQDTVHHYEEKGKAKALENSTESQYERGMKALSSLDRVQQVEAITEYNAMKEQLKEYLQKFADNKKVVREEDIREFFSAMAARKKQRVEVPHFCR